MRLTTNISVECKTIVYALSLGIKEIQADVALYACAHKVPPKIDILLVKVMEPSPIELPLTSFRRYASLIEKCIDRWKKKTFHVNGITIELFVQIITPKSFYISFESSFIRILRSTFTLSVNKVYEKWMYKFLYFKQWIISKPRTLYPRNRRVFILFFFFLNIVSRLLLVL